eukprot:3756356-Amphidinium_carterae.1
MRLKPLQCTLAAVRMTIQWLSLPRAVTNSCSRVYRSFLHNTQAEVQPKMLAKYTAVSTAAAAAVLGMFSEQIFT